MTEPTPSPIQAWSNLLEGNMRFVLGMQAHPNQDAARRDELTGGQNPFAAVLGCADSRVSAEVIFDQGLGDLFVVRTAGHACGPTELGSLEYAACVLKTPLIVVLGHHGCGAIKATMQSINDGKFPRGFIRDIVQQLAPSVITALSTDTTSVDEIEALHVRQTVRNLCERSHLIAQRISDGELGIIGVIYDLVDGKVKVVHTLGFEPSCDLPTILPEYGQGDWTPVGPQPAHIAPAHAELQSQLLPHHGS